VLRRPPNMDHIIHGIQNGTAVLVTDGSFKDGLGTAAFALCADLIDQDGVDAVNMTPGSPIDIDPYRAELAGIYGCIRLISLVTKKYNVTPGKLMQ
jgi:hypothetical protein